MIDSTPIFFKGWMHIEEDSLSELEFSERSTKKGKFWSTTGSFQVVPEIAWTKFRICS